jgi:hypothetical protein
MLKEESVIILIPELDASVALDGLYNVLVNADKRYGTVLEDKSISVYTVPDTSNAAFAEASNQFATLFV